ncbi:putative membrane transporter protein [Planctomycetales bacterium 10988]|nr:putative membrane transporter protein [Planctomycetales bacterium 10988]
MDLLPFAAATDWTTPFLCFAGVMVLAGFTQSFLGFGYAIVALSLLPFFFEIHHANVLISFAIVIPMVWLTWLYRGDSDKKAIMSCIWGIALGLPLGIGLFSYLNADWLVRGTGLLIFLIALDGFRSRKEEEPDKGKRPYYWATIAGSAGGFLAGAVGIPGPPIVAYSLRQPWTPTQYRAFNFSVFITLTIYKAVLLGVTGWLTWEVGLWSISVTPLIFIGMGLGILAARKVDAGQFRKLTFLILALTALMMLYRGSPDPEPNPTESIAPQATEATTQ